METIARIAPADLTLLRAFIGPAQRASLTQLVRGEEGEWFAEKSAAIAEQIRTMAHTYQTDGQGDDAVAVLHYFTASADWYITEKDSETEQLQAFGLADLGYGAELGYISIAELLSVGAELDLHYEPQPLRAIRAKRATA